MTNVTAHSKRVNVVTEPGSKNDYTVPCYSYMKPGSRRANVLLRNLTSNPIELNKGSVVARVQAANAVPPMRQTRYVASEGEAKLNTRKSTFGRGNARSNKNDSNNKEKDG